VYFGLGSNLADREENINRAIYELKNHGIEVEKKSSIIETAPVGEVNQGKFLNAVVKASTPIAPHELLRISKSIEKKMGRIKTFINGPRIIDIDILLYDRLQLATPQLTLPHPRMFDRNFVMIPLKEIDPELVEDLCHAHH